MSVTKLTNNGVIASAKYDSFKANNQPVMGVSYESIATATVTSGGTTSSIVFSSIPQTFTHLQLRGFCNTSTANLVILRFNSNVSNYSFHYTYGGGAGTPTSGGGGGASGGYIQDTTSTSATYTSSVTDILDYTSTNKYKTFRTLAGYDINGSGAIRLWSGSQYSDATAISTITLLLDTAATVNQYSSFALYGIK